MREERMQIFRIPFLCKNIGTKDQIYYLVTR